MKERVLKALKQYDQVSGEELAKALGVSRTAVWKYINELRGDGYQIGSSPGKGYYLMSAPDNLLPEEIKSGLSTKILGQRIEYFREVTSTQEVARSLAAQGANEGTTVIAEVQTKGRGRIERFWVSPPGGVYFSIILRPGIKPSEALRFPLIVGVAVTQAIEKLTNLSPRLKWPNDVIIAGRKTAGILTEISAEMDCINYIIVGMGINVNTDISLLPAEVRETATSLKEEYRKEVSRVKLVQGILEELDLLYEEFKSSGFDPIRLKWKSLSNTIGAWVRVSSGREIIEGEAINIDEDGALFLRKENGIQERIVAGDVSLRNLRR